jgi:hypothetical protein
LAKYVLLRLVNDHDSIGKIAENFDKDKRFIYEVVTFLEDIGWMRQKPDGYFKMTRKGKINMITRHRCLINFRRAE